MNHSRLYCDGEKEIYIRGNNGLFTLSHRTSVKTHSTQMLTKAIQTEAQQNKTKHGLQFYQMFHFDASSSCHFTTSCRFENMHKVQQSHLDGDAQRIRSSIFGLMSSCFDEISKIYCSIKIGLDPFKKNWSYGKIKHNLR